MAGKGFRDALGSVHVVRQFTSSEPPRSSEAVYRVPREENVHLNHHTVVLDTAGKKVEGKSDMKITSMPAPSPDGATPRPKRVLPTLPAAAGSHREPFNSSKENMGFDMSSPLPQSTTREAFSPSALAAAEDGGARDGPCLQPLPPQQRCRFCTATGPGTALLCMHCSNAYCMACLQSAEGSMFARDHDDAPYLRCPKCGHNPRTCPIAERPPWAGSTSVPGAPLLPMVGCDRREEEKLLRAEDKLFLSLLRTDAPVATADLDHTRAPPRAGLPSVFQRLTDTKSFSGAHKHRFSADGVGLGLDGRRDDTLSQRVIAGQGMITRDIEPEIDCPHRPALAFESRPASATPRARRSDDAVPEVYQRLAKSPGSQPSGEYDVMQKVRKEFGARTWKGGD